MYIGYYFHVEGECCTRLKGFLDPCDEDWETFEMSDLHPAGKPNLHIWVPNFREHCDEAKKIAIDRAIVVADWMLGEQGWEGFYADLWLSGQRVFSWKIC